MGIFLKLCISINSNGASVDRTAETRAALLLTRTCVNGMIYTTNVISRIYHTIGSELNEARYYTC